MPGRAQAAKPVPRWATVPEHRPPAAGRPARVMRPAGGLFAPKAHPGPDGSGILPSRGGLRPHESVGGLGRRGQIYGRRCAALVFRFAAPPPLRGRGFSGSVSGVVPRMA